METQGVPSFQEISFATISWKDHGNSFLGLTRCSVFEFMPHKTTIIGDTYASTMVALRENIKQKRRGKLSAGVLLLHDNVPPHKTTIIGDTYASTMVALGENIKQKCRGKLSAAVLLLHDNASAHEPCTSRAAIRKCGFVELNQPPYSPDLVLSDYFLFKNL